jgi:hypothetical protein
MNRENIILEFGDSGFCEDYIPEGFEFIEETQTYFDGEKGYCDYEVIIKRLSDNKFFKGQHTDYGKHEGSVNKVWVEVFPKQITITTYE